MSKYIDTFADAAVTCSSFADTLQPPQDIVGTKKKIKIDASLLLNLDVFTSLLTRPNADAAAGETKEKCGQVGSKEQPPCTNPNC